VTRKKTRTVKVEIPTDDDEPTTRAERAAELAADAGMDEDDAEEMFRGLDELRATQGVVFQVYRTEPIDRRGYLFAYPANLFTLERVRQDCGAGTYQVRVKANDRFIQGGVTFKIAEGVLPAEGRGGTGKTSSVEDVLAILKADKEKSLSHLRDWAAVLTPLLAPAIASWFTPKNELAELVKALAAMKGLAPDTPPPPDMSAQLDNLASAVAKLKELAGDSGPSTGSTWVDIVRDGITAARPILEGLAIRGLAARAPATYTALPSPVATVGAIPPAVVVGPPGGAGADGRPAAPPTPPPTNGEAPPAPAVEAQGARTLLPWLTEIASQMAYQASRDKDPEFYAEVVLDNLPEGTEPRELLKWIDRPDWFELLSQLVPAVAPYRGWFEKFRAAILDTLKEEGGPTPPPAGAQPNNGEELGAP